MDEEIGDSTWSEEDIGRLNEFEEDRNLVLRATRRLFRKLNDDFQGRVLEVGSGTGSLRRNWPDEFHGEWIQLDSQPAMLGEAKRRFPDGTYVCGSVYRLPFSDESLDVVCGLGAYDVLMDLETAVKETSRLLKKGGMFFHMLDLYPCDKPIVRDLEKRHVPLQLEQHERPDGYVQTESISFIPEEKLEAFYQKSANIKDEGSGLDDFDGTLRQDQKIWSRYAQVVRTHDYFGGKIIQALLSHFDIETVESGKLSAKYEGKRTQQQKQQEGEPFVFSHDSGIYHVGYKLDGIGYKILKLISPSLAQRLEPSCLEVSTVRYVKARKQC